MPLLKSMKRFIDFSSLLNLFRVKAKLAGISKCRFCFLYIQNIILVARRSHSNGDIVRHLGFLNRFFAYYWRSIRKSIEL